MTNEMLIDWIKKRKRNVYSVLVKKYKKEIASFGVSLFVEWLTKTELKIDKKFINRSSIYSALKRIKDDKEEGPSNSNASSEEKKKPTPPAFGVPDIPKDGLAEFK